MFAVYRGCQIQSESDAALGGWSEVYWSAFTDDLYEITSGFGGGSVREMFDQMKKEVDYFLDVCSGDIEKHIAEQHDEGKDGHG